VKDLARDLSLYGIHIVHEGWGRDDATEIYRTREEQYR